MTCKKCNAQLTVPNGKTLTICPFCQTDNSTADGNVTKAIATNGAIRFRKQFINDKSLHQNNTRIIAALKDIFNTESNKFTDKLEKAVKDNLVEKITNLLTKSIAEQKTNIIFITNQFADNNDWTPEQVLDPVRILAFGVGVSKEVLAVLASLENGQSTIVDNKPKSNHKNQSPKPKKGETIPLNPQIGKIIQFSGYDWRILDIQNNQALIFSELVLEKRPYHKQAGPTSWKKCTLRHYLNNGFYSQLAGKDKIAPSTTEGDNHGDKIFLLSYEEVKKYFEQGKYKIPNQPGLGIFVPNPRGGIGGIQANAQDILRIAGDVVVWWWLRDDFPLHGAFIDNAGCVHILRQGKVSASEDGGVRPALWLNL